MTTTFTVRTQGPAGVQQADLPNGIRAAVWLKDFVDRDSAVSLIRQARTDGIVNATVTLPDGSTVDVGVEAVEDTARTLSDSVALDQIAGIVATWDLTRPAAARQITRLIAATGRPTTA